MSSADASPPSAGDLAERFRRDLTAALGRAVTPGECLALAVSGGPDSMAMLWLAVQAYPGQVTAATFDHRFRAASADEARAVGDACRGLQVDHQVLAPSLPQQVFRHAEARAGRYAALERWAVEAGASILLTAHHADDQAETLLMRLNRGSGLAGLAGIRARRQAEVSFPLAGQPGVFDVVPLSIVRPLLTWRRVELRAVAQGSALGFVDDPSNIDDRFERAGVRRFFAAQDWLDPAALARSAAHLGETDADLRTIGAWLWQQRRVVPTGVDDPDDQVWLDIADLPRELRRRLCREAIRHVRMTNGVTPDFDPATHIEPLLDALEAGRAATQADVMVSPHGTVWRFRPAPPRRS
jgi:tRNA(Ile)-lysidine synthase